MTQELSEFFIEKAKNELGETESRREQTIKEFRVWLDKHPYIKFPDIDDFEILKFIRPLKFRLPKACRAFELFLQIMKAERKYFETPQELMPRILSLYECGGVAFSNKRNFDGSQIIFFNVKIFEDMEVTTEEIIRMMKIGIISLFLKVETQISGIVAVLDCRKISIKLLKKVPLKLLLKYFPKLNFFPMRVKKIIFMGLPKIIADVVNYLHSLLPKKFKERILFLKDESELLKHLDKNLLIEELGGNLKKADSIEDYRETFLKAIDHLNTYMDKYEIDFDKIESSKYNFESFKYDFDKIESFKNLDFD